MGDIIDFVHYSNTGDVIPVEPCGKGGHNYRHVQVYEMEDRFFIFCFMCRESALGLDSDDFYKFLEGVNPLWKCERPYHHPKNVMTSKSGVASCKRCLVNVKEMVHPSHKDGEAKWYG